MTYDGLNSALNSYLWVNNSILYKSYFAMIWKADIERSRSNVAMNAWLPKASYSYDKTDTSCCKLFKTEELFAPLREISVHFEMALGHLYYYLRCTTPDNFTA